MAVKVRGGDDAAEAWGAAGDFLLTEPVRHTIFITFVQGRVAHRETGRYWWAEDEADGAVVGFAMQAPVGFYAGVAPTSPDVVDALCDRIIADGVELPGVIAEAAVAARFAGRWAERLAVPARPTEGQRVYALDRVIPASGPPVPGRLRPAVPDDRETLVRWGYAFLDAVGPFPVTPETMVDRPTAEGRLWVWDDDGPAAMANATVPSAGVVRIGFVYTPPERRRRGYASACVAGLSSHLLAVPGVDRCTLFTQLHNPTSNAIYRRMGYEPVAEVVFYDFGAQPAL
jgi:GNAT superfamily N-acetyltransferase